MASVDDLLDELDDLLSEPPPPPLPKSHSHQSHRHLQNIHPPQKPTEPPADLSPAARRHRRAGPARAETARRAGLRAVALAAAVGAFPGGSDDTATRMRCSKCDHKVLRFVDKQWAADADYMFFRNFMPNVDKLSAKLKPKDGYCAFSCQCQWTTVELGAPHGISSWFATRNLD